LFGAITVLLCDIFLYRPRQRPIRDDQYHLSFDFTPL
jgi:hypothetical protein